MVNPPLVRKFQYNSTVLISPLPWGLGHAARCIPLISELLQKNCNIIIGASGETKTLLSLQFPQLQIITHKGYSIKYSNSKFFFPFKILLQIPGILNSIITEHRQLKSLINTYNIDVIISDNRPGLFNKDVHSIYITHQLKIKTGGSLAEKVSNKIHDFFIKKFDECWVPDNENNFCAGELSKNHGLKNVKYIGPISRFINTEIEERKYKIIVVLSGPEPQRTILENLLLKQLNEINYEVFFVRGSNIPMAYQNKNKLVEIVNILNSENLNEKIQQSNIVICRSGYTSIMDLIKLKKKAILIATPGQTEQEYLASFHHKNGTFLSYKQNGFNLLQALKAADTFKWNFPEVNMGLYKKAIEDLVSAHLNNRA